MKKLMLDLDVLTVESFDTAPARRGAGTVHGNGYDAFAQFEGIDQAQAVKTNIREDCGSFIDNCPSAWGTCDSCKQSCLGTCVTCATCVDETCNSCPSGPICID